MRSIQVRTGLKKFKPPCTGVNLHAPSPCRHLWGEWGILTRINYQQLTIQSVCWFIENSIISINIGVQSIFRAMNTRRWCEGAVLTGTWRLHTPHPHPRFALHISSSSLSLSYLLSKFVGKVSEVLSWIQSLVLLSEWRWKRGHGTFDF